MGGSPGHASAVVSDLEPGLSMAATPSIDEHGAFDEQGPQGRRYAVEVQLEQDARDSDDERAPRQLTARSRRCVTVTASLHTLCVGADYGASQSLTKGNASTKRALACP